MRVVATILFISLLFSCKNKSEERVQKNNVTAKTIEDIVNKAKDSLIYPEEKHFKSLRQVTFGGDNAEAY